MNAVIEEGKKYIKNANLKKALGYLIPIFEANNKRNVVKDLLLIQHRFKDCEKRYSIGIISTEDRNVEINKLCKSVIDILDSYDDKDYLPENIFKSFLGTVVSTIVLVVALAFLIMKLMTKEYSDFYQVFLGMLLTFLVVSVLLFVMKKFNALYSIFTDIWLGVISFIFIIPLFINFFGEEYIVSKPSLFLVLIALISLVTYLIQKVIDRYDDFLTRRGMQKVLGVLLSITLIIVLLDCQFLIEEAYKFLNLTIEEDAFWKVSNSISETYSVVPTQIKHILYPVFLALYAMYFILTNLQNQQLHE